MMIIIMIMTSKNICFRELTLEFKMRTTEEEKL